MTLAPVPQISAPPRDIISNPANESPGTVPFEGVEKRLTVLLKPGVSARKIPDTVWEKVCVAGGCEIVSKKSLKDGTVYLLSESTLFVTDNLFILKTCGRTVPLKAFKFILDYYAENCDDLTTEPEVSERIASATPQKLTDYVKRFGDEGSLVGSTRATSDEATVPTLSRAASDDIANVEEVMEVVGLPDYPCQHHLKEENQAVTGDPSQGADIFKGDPSSSASVSRTPSTVAGSEDDLGWAKASGGDFRGDSSKSRFLDFVDSVLFTRLLFIHPQHQVWPHTSFEEEQRYLSRLLPRGLRLYATVLGSVHAIHATRGDTSANPFRLEEILTLGIEEDCVRRLTGYDNASERQMLVEPEPRHRLKECIRACELELDEFWFDPCGYSANVLCSGPPSSPTQPTTSTQLSGPTTTTHSEALSFTTGFSGTHAETTTSIPSPADCSGIPFSPTNEQRSLEGGDLTEVARGNATSAFSEHDDFNYFSCHISPEPVTSYASLELCSSTKMQNTSLDSAGGSLIPIVDLLSVFNPRRVFITRVILGTEEPPLLSVMPPTAKEYVCRLSPSCFLSVWEL